MQTFALAATRGQELKTQIEQKLARVGVKFDDMQAAISAVKNSKVDFFPAVTVDGLANLATVVSAQVLALQETLTFRYSRPVEVELWAVIQKSLEDLIAGIARRGRGDETVNVDRLSNALHDNFVQLDFAKTTEDISDCLRFAFAVLTCIRLGRLVHSLTEVERTLESSASAFPWARVVDDFTQTVSNLFSLTRWKQSVTYDPRLYLKFALIFQVVTQVILVWHIAEPNGIARNAIWVIIPLFYIVQPTFGTSLRRGIRGFVAVAVGGGLGIASIVLSDSNDTFSYYLQVFLVVFTAALLNFLTGIEFTSYDAAITWIIVALANWQFDISDETRLEYATNRIVLTCIGAAAAVISGFVLLPRFSIVIFRTASGGTLVDADALIKSAISFASSIKAISPRPDYVTSGELIYAYHAAAGFEANERLRVRSLQRALTRLDAAAEVVALKFATLNFRRSPASISSAQVLGLEELLIVAEKAAVVMFSTSAAAISSQEIHDHVFGGVISGRLVDLQAQVSAAVSLLSQALQSSIYIDLSSLNLISSTNCIEEDLITLHLQLANMGTLSKYVEEGLLRLYAFFYSLSFFVAALNNLILSVTGSQTQSSSHLAR